MSARTRLTSALALVTAAAALTMAPAGAPAVDAAEVPTTFDTGTLVHELERATSSRSTRTWTSDEDRVRLTALERDAAGVRRLLVELRDDAGWAELEFTAPAGQVLGEGAYAGAGSSPERSPADPLLLVRDGRGGCSDPFRDRWQADFTVHRWSDDLRDVHITWEQQCYGDANEYVPVVELGRRFGEVRTGAPVQGGLLAAPTRIEWPVHERGQASTAVPVQVRNVGTSRVEPAPAISGDADVELGDSCGPLGPGDGCRLVLTDAAADVGEERGALSLGDGLPTVRYGETGAPGRTALALGTRPGAERYTAQDSYFAGVGTRDTAAIGVYRFDARGEGRDPVDGDARVGLHVPGGIEAGRTYRFDGEQSGAGGLTGDARCPQRVDSLVEVEDFALDAQGRMTRLSMRWVCFTGSDETPYTTGSLAWRTRAARAPFPEQPRPAPDYGPNLSPLVTSSGVLFSWPTPNRADIVATELWLVPGSDAPRRPRTGRTVYDGPGDEAVVPGLRVGRDYTVSAFYRLADGSRSAVETRTLLANTLRAVVLPQEPAPGQVRVLFRLTRTTSGAGLAESFRVTVGDDPDEAEEQVVTAGPRGYAVVDVPRGSTVRAWRPGGGLQPYDRPVSTAPFTAEPGQAG